MDADGLLHIKPGAIVPPKFATELAREVDQFNGGQRTQTVYSDKGDGSNATRSAEELYRELDLVNQKRG